MNTNPCAETSIPRVPWRQAPLVLLLLAAAILALTWPWAQTFSTAFLEHWDPPFHAWKLELVARTILSGHLLPAEGNTNMYYPHSGALYFEALHWPQALVAAGLFSFLDNPVLVYHLVLIFFWALSGACFWMLLLAMGATRRAALLGALLFALMPYRISYMVEFNMQLCFGLPLFFFFLLRFFQRPSIRYACGMAVAWWLQASSELYQAVFLLLILPFPGLALMAGQWRLFGSFRRFWLPAACAAALGGALAWIFLGPYLTLLNAHEVNRDLHEIAKHVLEPLSYLRPGERFHLLAPFQARRDEMIVYPTFALILLAATHLFFDARRLARIAVPRWLWVARAIRWTALALFMVLAFFIYFSGAPEWVASIYAVLPVVATLAALLVLLHPAGRDPATRLTTGLFAGAIFAFFMSLGPEIGSRHSHFAVDNVLFIWMYKHLSALQGFRVVSRFSIYVLIFMVAASALAWSHVERRWLKRPALRWLWLLPLVLAICESVPNPFVVRPLEYPLSSSVLESLDRMEDPYVLAVVPMGVRNYDSRHMLQIARTDRLFVYAWGGAYPKYTQDVFASLRPLDPRPAETARLLRQLWPECFVLVDKPFSQTPAPSMMGRLALMHWRPHDYADLFSAETDILAEDDRFALLRLKPETEPAAEQIRLIRHDFLAAHPLLAFRARTPSNVPSATLWLDVNGYPAGRWEIAPEAREFQIAVPRRLFLPLLPNRLRFHAESDAPFHLDAFEPRPAGNDPLPAVDEILASESLPWLGHLDEVPAAALPLDIRYPNGFAILACEPVETVSVPGGAVRLRHYVQSPRDMRVAANVVLRVRLVGPDGKWIEEGIALDAAADLNDVLCQIRPGIYALDQTIPIPERLVPGDYKMSLVLRNGKGKRLGGEQNGKSGKLFPVAIPIRIQAPAGP